MLAPVGVFHKQLLNVCVLASSFCLLDHWLTYDHCHRYPGAEKNTLEDISLFCTLNSRVAVLGPNGAGKSTMIKVLTGELEPSFGNVWRHPNMRVAYVAQHAFHHIEQVWPLLLSPSLYLPSKMLSVVIFFTAMTGAGSPLTACFMIPCFVRGVLKAYMSLG